MPLFKGNIATGLLGAGMSEQDRRLLTGLLDDPINRARSGMASLMSYQPYPKSITLGDIAMPAMSMIPGAGDALDAAQAAYDWQAGRKPEAIINAMGAALPYISGPMLKGGAGLLGIISPEVAKKIPMSKSLPSTNEFMDAVKNTKGAKITSDGLQLNIERWQLPEQGMTESVRGGVFYLPEGSVQAKYYKGSKNTYGGSEQIKGETLFKKPLFVKGATGGKAPEAAYNQILGNKKAYENMRADALKVTMAKGQEKTWKAEEFLNKYAPELSNYSGYIVDNSKQGNQLAYALQEAAAGSAVRNSGYDGVVGYSKKRTGEHFISEVFDVRESHYPDAFGGYRLHPDYEEMLK